ncbi:MAG: hypothetical protein E7L17_14400 [Clostridium sp.]|uniref:hypothetical protein n=1 Tax=Clostridium sp. TaxID=1506 RepID=UPI00290E7D29|nr:hypothetical protein [Clostridium sp.]MDU7339290.1 hypothetical protein [Clostridium sp.]
MGRTAGQRPCKLLSGAYGDCRLFSSHTAAHSGHTVQWQVGLYSARFTAPPALAASWCRGIILTAGLRLPTCCARLLGVLGGCPLPVTATRGEHGRNTVRAAV